MLFHRNSTQIWLTQITQDKGKMFYSTEILERVMIILLDPVLLIRASRLSMRILTPLTTSMEERV